MLTEYKEWELCSFYLCATYLSVYSYNGMPGNPTQQTYMASMPTLISC